MNNSFVHDYDSVESLLCELLRIIEDIPSDGESLTLIHHFIGFAEYGLAFELIVELVLEEKKQIPYLVVDICEKLVVLMKYSGDEIDLSALRELCLDA